MNNRQAFLKRCEMHGVAYSARQVTIRPGRRVWKDGPTGAREMRRYVEHPPVTRTALFAGHGEARITPRTMSKLAQGRVSAVERMARFASGG